MFSFFNLGFLSPTSRAVLNSDVKGIEAVEGAVIETAQVALDKLSQVQAQAQAAVNPAVNPAVNSYVDSNWSLIEGHSVRDSDEDSDNDSINDNDSDYFDAETDDLPVINHENITEKEEIESEDEELKFEDALESNEEYAYIEAKVVKLEKNEETEEIGKVAGEQIAELNEQKAEEEKEQAPSTLTRVIHWFQGSKSKKSSGSIVLDKGKEEDDSEYAEGMATDIENQAGPVVEEQVAPREENRSLFSGLASRVASAAKSAASYTAQTVVACKDHLAQKAGGQAKETISSCSSAAVRVAGKVINFAKDVAIVSAKTGLPITTVAVKTVGKAIYNALPSYETIVESFVSFSLDAENVKTSIKRELSEIIGNQAFVDELAQTGRIKDLVRQKIPGILLNRMDPKFLDSLVEVIMLQVFVNIAHKVKEDKPQLAKDAFVLEMVDYFFGFIHSTHSEMKETFERLDAERKVIEAEYLQVQDKIRELTAGLDKIDDFQARQDQAAILRDYVEKSNQISQKWDKVIAENEAQMKNQVEKWVSILFTNGRNDLHLNRWLGSPLLSLAKSYILPSIMESSFEKLKGFEKQDIEAFKKEHLEKFGVYFSKSEDPGKKAEVKEFGKNLFGALSEKALESIFGAFAKDEAKAKEIVFGLLKDRQMNEAEWKVLFDAIKAYSKDHKVLAHLHGYVKDIVELVLLKLAPNLGNKSTMQAIFEGFKKVDAQVIRNAIQENPDMSTKEIAAKYKNELMEQFCPLVDTILERSFPAPANGANGLSDLPIPNSLKQPIWDLLKNEVLPNLFAENAVEITKFETNKEKHVDAIEKNAPHAALAPRLLTNMIMQLVPHFLKKKNQKIATEAVKTIESLFDNKMNEEEKNAAKYIKDHEDSAISYLSDIFTQVNEAPETKEALGLIKDKIEGGIAEVLHLTIERLDERDKADPVASASLGLRVLEIFTNHLKKMNDVKEELSKQNVNEAWGKEPFVHAHEIPVDEMLKHYANPNPGTPLSGEAEMPGITKKRRMEQVFKPLTPKVMKIIQMNNPDLLEGIPEAARGEFIKMVEEFVPHAINFIFEKISKPENMEKLLLGVLEGMYEELEKYIEGQYIPKPSSTSKLPADLKKRMNEVSEELLIQLSHFAPNTFVNKLIKIGPVKKVAGNAVGELAGDWLKKQTLVGILDLVAKLGIPKLGKEMNWTTDLKGKIITQPLPENAEYKLDAKKQTDDDQERTTKRVNAIFRNVINIFPSVIKKATIRSLWNSFQNKLDIWIKRWFGEIGMSIKTFLDKVFRAIFIDGFGTLIKIGTWIVIAIGKLFYRYRAKKIVNEINISKHIKNPVNQNLILDLLVAVIDELAKDPAPSDSCSKRDSKVVSELEEETKKPEVVNDQGRVGHPKTQRHRGTEAQRIAKD